MAGESAGQKRRHERLPYIRSITWQSNPYSSQEAGDHIEHGTSINISDGGLCVLVNKPLEESQVIKVSVPFAEMKVSVKTVAKVRWTQEVPHTQNWYFAGLCFVL